MLPVIRQHLVEWKAGEDVSVDNHERVTGALHLAKATGGAKRMILFQVA